MKYLLEPLGGATAPPDTRLAPPARAASPGSTAPGTPPDWRLRRAGWASRGGPRGRSPPRRGRSRRRRQTW
eukprot:1420631-Alexandrium_andersonii.AAC.1